VKIAPGALPFNPALIRVVWQTYSLGHVDQSHTNNGFFKLVEALLIYSGFFSHSIILHLASR